MRPVVALYVDPERGPYVPLLGREACWGERRNAKLYGGPWPVVAHPPCGPWGRLSGLCRHQDPECGPVAVAQVRCLGGVLEHPKASRLWSHCSLPAPWLELPADHQVGREWALEVAQCRWGHPARKDTWLLFVDVPPSALAPLPPWREPTHVVSTSRRDSVIRLPSLGSAATHLTPPAFARWLVHAARSVRRAPAPPPSRAGSQPSLFGAPP